jgi:hypothetical protein
MDQTPGDPNDPIQPPRGRDCPPLTARFRPAAPRPAPAPGEAAPGPTASSPPRRSDLVQHAFLNVARDLDAFRLFDLIGPVRPGRGSDEWHVPKT